MDATGRTTQIMFAAFVAGLIVLFAIGYKLSSKSHKLVEQTNLAEQRADSLLSAKLQLEGDVRWMNKQLTAIKEDNISLQHDLETVNQRLSASQSRQRALRRRNESQELSIRELSQQLTGQLIVRDSLEAQMEAMHGKINWQQDSIDVIASQREKLTNQLSLANARLLTLVPRSALTADNFRVEATKSNNKVTTKAKKINILTVSFELPDGLGLTGIHEVYLSVTNEQHESMMKPLQTITVALPTVNERVPVQAVHQVDFDKIPRRLSFEINPTEPVAPGVYRASIYTKNAYLGSVQCQFRDSFLFF